MATSSIFKDFVIDNNSQAEHFLKAYEDSKEFLRNKAVPPVVYDELTEDDIIKLFAMEIDGKK